MKLKEYKSIGESVYSEQLENGLMIKVIPKRGFNKRYAFFATDYGGADRRFQLAGQWKDTPEGVAHFLEHKMFDTKDGNALTRLSENGASPNAFTSADMTAYHFESTDHFDENLKILLDFVSVPYFTDESVRKEQGIIGQEIRMTEDDPEYNVYYNLMKSLYRTNPIRDSVAGTIDSIAEITATTLYDCHRVFYHPSNMVLCVAGDVDPATIVSAAREILPKNPGEVPERDYGEAESLFPERGKFETSMEVSQTLFLAGCKALLKEDGPSQLRQELTGEMALALLMGRSSPLFIRLYGDGLINNTFSYDFESAAGAAYVLFGGESKDPDAVCAEIQKEAASVAAGGPDQQLFARLKKAFLGKKLRELNAFDAVCYGHARGYFRGYDVYESLGFLNSITAEDVRSFVQENITGEKMAVSVVQPVSKDEGKVR